MAYRVLMTNFTAQHNIHPIVICALEGKNKHLTGLLFSLFGICIYVNLDFKVYFTKYFQGI